jgi:hypothetical protein
LQRDRGVGASQITASDCQEGFDVFGWHALVPQEQRRMRLLKHDLPRRFHMPSEVVNAAASILLAP